MTGTWALVWKEWREQFWPGHPSRLLWGIAAPAVLFPVVFMFIIGAPAYADLASGVDDQARAAARLGLMGAAFLGAALAAFMAPLTTVSDMFAGERERHTLETLLATPLRDAEILGGKFLVQLLVAIGASVLGALSATVVLLVALGSGVLGPAAALSLGLIAGVAPVQALFILIGLWFSMRARTVKGAQQAMALVVVVPPMLLFGAIAFLTINLVDGTEPDVDALARTGVLVVVGSLALVVLVAALVVVGTVRACRRDRLMAVR